MDSTSNLHDEMTPFLDAESDRLGGVEEQHPDPAGPQVILKGVLELTRDQEDSLVAWVDSRLQAMETELGRDRVILSDRGYQAQAAYADLDTFCGRRRIFELMYNKRVDWRVTAIGQLFARTNLHVPIIRRFVQQQIARAQNYFFQTEPWFSVNPQGAADVPTATKINRFAQWKFRAGKIKAVFDRAIEKAMIRGEAVVKTAAAHRSDFYEEIAEVAVTEPGGEILLANDGKPIKKGDAVTAAVDEIADPATGEMMRQTVIGPDNEPVMVLARDPQTQVPTGGFAYESRRIRAENVHYHGPEAEMVYYLDFLCPENAPSVQDAEIVAHYYDVPASALIASYLVRRDADPATAAQMLTALRDLGTVQPGERAYADGLRPEDGERRNHHPDTSDASEGMIGIAEVYLRRDVNGDGLQEEVALWMDRTSKRVIFYDYTRNVTQDGKRPFHVVRVNPVDGRWYGSGQVDLFWDLQQFIDLTMNRWNLSQSEAGRVTAWNPEACYEGDGNKNLVMNAGVAYRLKPGKTIEDLVQVKYLSDLKGSDLQAQMEYFQQMALNLSGVASANDAHQAGLDSGKLATGIRNIEKAGQEMFAPLISHLEEGITSACESLLKLLVATMTEAEVFPYFEGDIQHMDQIQPAEMADMDFLVEMELTRYKNEQQLEQVLAALGIIERFYALDPTLQEVAAPLYRRALKLFDIPHADTLIVPGAIWTGEQAQQFLATAGAKQAAGPTNPGESEPNL